MKSVPEESEILGRAIRERTKSSAHQLWFLRGGREKLGFRCEGQNWFIVITQGASLDRSVLLKREKGFVGQEDGGFCFVHNGRDGTDCTAPSVCRLLSSVLCGHTWWPGLLFHPETPGLACGNDRLKESGWRTCFTIPLCYQKSTDVNHQSAADRSNQDSMGNSNLDAVVTCAVESSFHPCPAAVS